MTIGERIKFLRQELDFNQTEFGKKIGLKQTAIGMYENNQRTVPDTTILLISQTYSVSLEWLRDGTGEMFKHDAASVVDQLTREYILDNVDRAILERYMELGPIQRKVIKQYIQSLTSAFVKDEVEAYAMPAQGNSAAHGVVSSDDKEKLGEIKNALLDEDDSSKLL
ncbi:MAG: helix-turn-helix transcriptional regulator [Oscillospiraceae bacterium]